MIRRVDMLRFAAGSVLCLSAAVTPCIGQTTRVSTPLASASVADSLADLEVQRIRLHATQPEVPTVEIDSLIRNLRDRLHRLPANDSASKVAVERVLQALDVRRASVSTALRNMRLAYTDNYPTVRLAIEETRLIDERRKEIRTSGF